MMHVDFSYFSGKLPLIFHHSSSKSRYDYGYMDAQFRYHTSSIDDVIERCQHEKTHCACAFIDHETTRSLPSPEFIAQFHIIVTTAQRLSNEWKNGSAEAELRRDRNLPDSAVCPLLKIHWLRLVVDEGHTMGRGSHGSAIQFASWITAQRRWAMTGTPTPQTNRQCDLRNILGLMNFLQHDFFSVRFNHGDKLWKACISRSWSEGSLEGYFRLCHLLSLLMRRHTKDSLQDLPPPRFTTTYTELSPSETMAYNTLTTVIRSNILITSMKALTSGWQDSLLNPRHARHAHEALRNVRLSCCGGTNLIPTLKQKLWDETLVRLKHIHNVSDIKVTVVNKFLQCATTGGTSSCGSCGIQLQLLLLLPCAHLLCTECVDSDANRCPVCEKTFDADDFQRLQPGFNITWAWNLSNGETSSRNNAGLSHATSFNLAPTEGGMQSEDVAVDLGLVPGQDIVQRDDSNDPSPRPNRRLKKGKPHICKFPNPFSNGLCILCHEEHNYCDLVNESLACTTCHRTAKECPDDESKACYLIRRLLQLHDEQNESSRRSRRLSDAASRIIGKGGRTRQSRELKVIIFSQFRQTLNLVGDRLLLRFGNGVIAEYWGSYREQELSKFKLSPKCFCMLLSKDGSHGLDLSFVTNIMFLDEIYDQALKHQVVARAYRMGAEGSVQVEQLVARSSIEELMVQMNKTEDDDESRESDIAAKGKNQKGGARDAKLHFLFTNLKLIRPEQRRTLATKRPIDDGVDKGTAKSQKQSRVRFNF